MKTFQSLLLSIIFCLSCNLSFAQEQDSIPDNWDITLGLGTDITQLLQVNPKVGAGENRFGVGWVINSIIEYKKDRLAWDNNVKWSFSIQRLGGGFFFNSEEKIPFQKSIDELRLGSKAGYKFSDDSKLFYAVDFSFLSQMLGTYDGNYLKDIKEPDIENDPISRFLSPGQITFSIGIDYKPSNHFSLFLSPIGYKSILVLDDNIADNIVLNSAGEITGSVHGNPITTDASKKVLVSFDNVQHKMGSLLRASYNNKFLEGKVTFKSGLVMYSNYLTDLKKIDYEWTTETNFVVFKGLHLSLYTTVFYDYDVFSFKTNYDQPGGIDPTPLRNLVSLTEQFVIKYNVVF